MSKYYLGVSDALCIRDATWEEMKQIIPDINKPFDPKECENFLEIKNAWIERSVNVKFLKDPIMAMMDACPLAFYYNDFYDKKRRSYFLKSIVYDPETKVYVFNNFTTLGLNLEPKDWHYEKFFKGEDFKLNLEHYDIQLLSTEVEDIEGLKFDITDVKTYQDYLPKE